MQFIPNYFIHFVQCKDINFLLSAYNDGKDVSVKY